MLKSLKEEPSFVTSCGLTPERLPSLVENNPMVAYECLLLLMPSPSITECVPRPARAGPSGAADPAHVRAASCPSW